MRQKAGTAVVLAATLVTAGCGLNMQTHYSRMRSDLVSGDYTDADAYVDSVKQEFYGKKNRLLYYMDKAMVLHLAGRYVESNRYLEQAKDTADELWTESVGSHAAAWMTTDNSLPYQGEDFEKVFLHLLGAVNYMGAGDFSAARVEARQVTAKLNRYNARYGKEHPNAYRDDAFARWLAGKMAETESGYSALNDAWIDYRKAIAVYDADYSSRYRTPLPRLVVQDALRVLDGLGADFREEFRSLSGRFPSVKFVTEEQARGLGEVVFLHLAGEAPFKRDVFWTAPTSEGILRVAYPEFVAKTPLIRAARLRIQSADGPVQAERMQDVTAIAIENLSDHMARIKAKAIARMVAKFVAQKGMRAGGEALSRGKSSEAQAAGAALQLASIVFNVGSAIAEEADKRSWITLPDRVDVARLWVPPGPFVLEIEYLGRQGELIRRQVVEGQVEAGSTKFLFARTFE